jgi:hypothetical protein
MKQGLDLKISSNRILGTIRDFEDETFPGNSRKLEILVPLTYQWVEPADDTELLHQRSQYFALGELRLRCRNCVKCVHCESCPRNDDWFRRC